MARASVAVRRRLAAAWGSVGLALTAAGWALDDGFAWLLLGTGMAMLAWGVFRTARA